LTKKIRHLVDTDRTACLSLPWRHFDGNGSISTAQCYLVVKSFIFWTRTKNGPLEWKGGGLTTAWTLGLNSAKLNWIQTLTTRWQTARALPNRSQMHFRESLLTKGDDARVPIHFRRKAECATGRFYRDAVVFTSRQTVFWAEHEATSLIVGRTRMGYLVETPAVPRQNRIRAQNDPIPPRHIVNRKSARN